MLQCTKEFIQITISDEDDITDEEFRMLVNIFNRKAAALGIKDFNCAAWTINLNCKLD